MSDQEVCSYKERADLLIELDRQREAIPLLMQALAIEPDDIYLLWSLVQAHYDLEDFDVALGYADRMVEIDPDWDAGHYWRSRALAKLNRLPEALEAAEAAACLDPEDQYTLDVLAWFQQECGHPAEAEATAHLLLEVAPDWSGAYFRMAWVYSQQGRAVLAEEYYRQALKIDPTGSSALNNLGFLFQTRGKEMEALETYYHALTLNPTDVTARANLNRMIDKAGFASLEEYQQCRTEAARLEYVTRRTTLLQCARDLMAKRSPLKAITILKSELPTYGDDPAFLDLLAEAHLANRSSLRALRYADAAIAAAPTEYVGYRRRALVLLRMVEKATGERRKTLCRDAVRAAEEAARVAVDQTAALSLLTCIQCRCDQLAEAEQTARRLIEAAPKWGYAYLDLANVYHQRKLWRLAEVYCRKALECDADDPDFHNSLGAALNAQHRFEEAIQHFERALQVNPNHVYAASNLKWARTGGKGWHSWVVLGQLVWSLAGEL
jgi:tetratricopeptide (TPR) repeat protein